MINVSARSVMRMRWRHLLFAHWPVDPQALRPLIPPALEIDTFDGRAWVGLIPFTMEDVGPLLLPRVPRVAQRFVSALSGGVTAFHECNVRTYVYPRSRPDDPAARGVWFFSLDATSRLAVWGARTFWKLPYFNARIHLHRQGDVIDYSVQRIPGASQPRATKAGSPALRIWWRALEAMQTSQPGSLAHFLTERYCLYTLDGHADDWSKRLPLAVYCGRIRHQPWLLRHAEVMSLDDSLVRAAGIDVDQTQPPVAYHADMLDVQACPLHCVQ